VTRNRVQSSVFAGRQPRAEQERQQQYERERRVTANRRLYQTAAWRLLRKLQLEDYPRCSEPGCDRMACVVDHRIPHRGNNSLFFDPANLRSMCKRCHDRKTAREDGGFGRAPLHPRTSEDDERGFGLAR
jgi:5-methylcytosine-specific restriction protein A